MPIGAQILTAQMQNENLVIWAIINAQEEKKENRNIVIIGTGHVVGDIANINHYINTIQVGAMVWHLFEEVN